MRTVDLPPIFVPPSMSGPTSSSTGNVSVWVRSVHGDGQAQKCGFPPLKLFGAVLPAHRRAPMWPGLRGGWSAHCHYHHTSLAHHLRFAQAATGRGSRSPPHCTKGARPARGLSAKPGAVLRARQSGSSRLGWTSGQTYGLQTLPDRKHGCAKIGIWSDGWLAIAERREQTAMVERYRNRRGVYKRRPLVNSKRELLIPTSEIDVCPMWQDKGLPAFGIPPATLFFYYPDGRWLLARPTGIGAYSEWEALTPLDARHWLLDNGHALETLSENARAALAWTAITAKRGARTRRVRRARTARPASSRTVAPRRAADWRTRARTAPSCTAPSWVSLWTSAVVVLDDLVCGFESEPWLGPVGWRIRLAHVMPEVDFQQSLGHCIRRSALILAARARGGRQCAHCRAGASIGKDEVILRLQVQPELRLSPEPVPEPEGGVAGYGTLTRDNLADSFRRHVNLASERSWGHAPTQQVRL